MRSSHRVSCTCSEHTGKAAKGSHIGVWYAQMKIDSPPIPTLLAVGALHHHLIRTGLRTETSIVADTAQCVSTHQLCTLIGYGVHAVCPYLAFETARQWRSAPR